MTMRFRCPLKWRFIGRADNAPSGYCSASAQNKRATKDVLRWLSREKFDKNLSDEQHEMVCQHCTCTVGVSPLKIIMCAPEESAYKGTFFSLSLHFPVSYPFEEPIIWVESFTKFIHPYLIPQEHASPSTNLIVYQYQGEHGEWSPVKTFLTCLHGLLSDLICPSPSSACSCRNEHLLNLFVTDIIKYREEIAEWVKNEEAEAKRMVIMKIKEKTIDSSLHIYKIFVLYTTPIDQVAT